eukprot:PhF_6_TR40190/c0_g1_i2/m.59630
MTKPNPRVYITDLDRIATVLHNHIVYPPTRGSQPNPYAAVSSHHLIFVNPGKILDPPADVLNLLGTYDPYSAPMNCYDLARSAIIFQQDCTIGVCGTQGSGRSTQLRSILKFVAVSGCIDVTDEQRAVCASMVSDIVQVVPTLERALAPLRITLGYTLTMEREYLSLVSWEVVLQRLDLPETWDESVTIPIDEETWSVLGGTHEETEQLCRLAVELNSLFSNAANSKQLIESHAVGIVCGALRVVNSVTKRKSRVDALAVYKMGFVKCDENASVPLKKYSVLDSTRELASYLLPREWKECVLQEYTPNMFSHILFCTTPFLERDTFQRFDGVRCDVQHVYSAIGKCVDIFKLIPVLETLEEQYRQYFYESWTKGLLECVIVHEPLRRKAISDLSNKEHYALVRQRFLGLQEAGLFCLQSTHRQTLVRNMELEFNTLVRAFYVLLFIRLQEGLDKSEVTQRYKLMNQRTNSVHELMMEADEEYVNVRKVEIEKWEQEYREIVWISREDYMRRMKYIRLEKEKHDLVETTEEKFRRELIGKETLAWRLLIKCDLIEPYVTQSLKELQSEETMVRCGWRGVGGIEVEERTIRIKIMSTIRDAKAVMLPTAELEHRMMIEGEEEIAFIEAVERFRQRLSRTEDRAMYVIYEYNAREKIENEENEFFRSQVLRIHLSRMFLYLQRDGEPIARQHLLQTYYQCVQQLVFHRLQIDIVQQEETIRRCLTSRMWIEIVSLFSREDVMFNEVKERTEKGLRPVHRPHARIVAEESVDYFGQQDLSGYNPIQKSLMRFFDQSQEMTTQTDSKITDSMTDVEYELLSAHQNLSRRTGDQGATSPSMYGKMMLAALARNPPVPKSSTLYFIK